MRDAGDHGGTIEVTCPTDGSVEAAIGRRLEFG
jgi:hypothetical protein